MSKLHILLLLISSIVLIANGKKGNSVATFRVYVHEFLSGPNATLHEVARADITADSPTSFGLVWVGDDSMTNGTGLDSEKLGQAQGCVINSGLTDSVVMLTVNFVFTAGRFAGSTITAVGWKHTSNVNQELPLVGGTGVFRHVRGYVVSNTYSYDPLTNYVVIIYDFYIENVGNDLLKEPEEDTEVSGRSMKKIWSE